MNQTLLLKADDHNASLIYTTHLVEGRARDAVHVGDVEVVAARQPAQRHRELELAPDGGTASQGSSPRDKLVDLLAERHESGLGHAVATLETLAIERI
jgi:hypothetical protein